MTLTTSDLEKIDRLLDKKLKSELKSVKEDVVEIRKDQKIIVRFFDKEYLELRK